MAVYCIGTSGWHYDDWRERFYPARLPKTKWLEFYAQQFDTVELNNSFYRLPSEEAFARWRDTAPADFCYAVKASRYVTHIKRLNDCAEAVKTFFDRAQSLGDKLGPALYQLPPDMERDDERLAGFLAVLPEDREQVIEFRHKSWYTDGVLSLLKQRKVGFCAADMPYARTPLAATADFAYIRFHGTSGQYGGSYTDRQMADWAKQIARLADGLKTVYVYFNNDVAAHAVENARMLRGLLGES